MAQGSRPALDLTRVAMAVLVVALHGQFLKDLDWTAKFVLSDVLSRLAVPWFFVVSGRYFRAETKDALIGWGRRLLVLFAIWMVVYLPFYVYSLSVRKVLSYALAGYRHLWFLIAMVEAGLILFVVRRWKASRKIVLASGLFLTGMGIQHYQIVYAMDNFNAYRNCFFVGLPFMLIGSSLPELNLKQFSAKEVGGALCVAVVALIAEASLVQFYFDRTQDLYVALFVCCPLLFVFCEKMDGRRSIIAAQISTAVYLVHPLFLTL